MFRVEIIQFRRKPVAGLLILVAGVNFLVGMSLFGLTGSHAPTALVNEGGGADVSLLVRSLKSAHRSFTVLPMSRREATTRLSQGELVAEIIIPRGFTNSLRHGDGLLHFVVDNVNIDQTDDVERAIPSAILSLGHALHLPGVRLHVHEQDLIGHDTDYIPYLTVSSLALIALVLGGVLGALSMTRELEGGLDATWKVWHMAPGGNMSIVVGKVAAATVMTMVGLLLATGLVALGYGVVPTSWPLVAVSLLLLAAVSSSVGVLIGSYLRRSAAVIPLIFGLGMPLYVLCGALEPVRFDGNVLWAIAHAMPTYYGIGLVEFAFHGLKVTPEPAGLDFGVLAMFGVAAIFVADWMIRRRNA